MLKFNFILKIDKCFRFYSEKMCIVTCPSVCNYNENVDGVVWQYETFYYLSLSSICQAAFHSKIFSNETKIYQAVLFKKTDNYFKNNFIAFNQTIVHSNGISTQLWPPSGLINYIKKIPKNYEIFHFRLKSNFEINLKPRQYETSYLDCLVMIKAVHFINSKKLALNSVNIQIYVYEEINESNLEINFQRLVPSNEENFDSFLNVMKSIISNRTVLKVDTNLYRIDLNITTSNFDYLKMLNNYFELTLKNNANILRGIIKFPINFISNNLTFSNYQTIRLRKNLTEYIRVENRIDRECTWYLLNIDLEISCNTNLTLKYDSLINDQNFIAYPNFYKVKMFAFTRVINNDDESLLNCKNGGVFANFCEKACPKGYIGKACAVKCPETDCKGYLICANDPLGCSCASGYSGFACDQPCSSNRWGPECRLSCEYCPKKVCDSFTGDCVCSNNFIGSSFL
jgi:hypothetical protein